MMRTSCLLIAILTMLHFGCRKEKSANIVPAVDTCSWKKLTSVKTNQGTGKISYNADGTLNHGMSYFNNGQLMVMISQTDTVVLDSIGRLRYLKTYFEAGARQTRYYYYDDQNRVIRTLTHTGNGINYIQALTYHNGDVIEMAYGHDSIGPYSSRFKFTYYDTVCVDEYFAFRYWTQIGQTRNTHLLKTYRYEDSDSTHYSYVLDSNKRVLVSYMNYDNSAWTYARATDTTWFGYSCK